MPKKPTPRFSASRRPPKPPLRNAIGSPPGPGGGRFRSSHPIQQGAIASYVHGGAKIGVLVELSCDTDFVARTDDFLNLAKELCLQVAATNPRWLKRDEVPPAVIKQKRRELEQRASKSKGEERSNLVEEQLVRFLSDSCLLEQAYLKEPSGRVKVKDLLTEAAAKFGENVQIRRFTRWEVGVD